MRLTFLALFLAAACPLNALAHAYAAHGDGRPYGIAKLGFFAPGSDDLDGFDNGPSLSVGFGRRLGPSLAVEAGIGWFQSETDSFALVNDSGAIVGDGHEELSIVPITGALKLLLPAGPVEPFVEAGAGLYFGELRLVDRTSFGRFVDEDDDVALGLHIGAGAAFRITPRSSLLLEARYHIAEMEFFGIEGRIDGATFNGGIAFHF